MQAITSLQDTANITKTHVAFFPSLILDSLTWCPHDEVGKNIWRVIVATTS